MELLRTIFAWDFGLADHLFLLFVALTLYGATIFSMSYMILSEAAEKWKTRNRVFLTIFFMVGLCIATAISNFLYYRTEYSFIPAVPEPLAGMDLVCVIVAILCLLIGIWLNARATGKVKHLRNKKFMTFVRSKKDCNQMSLLSRG